MYKFKESIEQGTRRLGEYYLEYGNINQEITTKEERKTEHEVAIAVLEQEIGFFQNKLSTLQNADNLRLEIIKKTLKKFAKRAIVEMGAITAITCLTPLTAPFGALAGIATLTIAGKRAVKKYKNDVDPIVEIEQENVEESLIAKIEIRKGKIAKHQNILDILNQQISKLGEKHEDLKNCILMLCNQIKALEENRQMAIDELLSNSLTDKLDECYDVTYGEANPTEVRPYARGRKKIKIGENV